MFNDIREFIELAKKSGECTMVEGADWDIEIGAITHLSAKQPNPPVLLFDKIKGCEAWIPGGHQPIYHAQANCVGVGSPPGGKRHRARQGTA